MCLISNIIYFQFLTLNANRNSISEQREYKNTCRIYCNLKRLFFNQNSLKNKILIRIFVFFQTVLTSIKRILKKLRKSFKLITGFGKKVKRCVQFSIGFKRF